jgi:hypothetical protein
MKIQHWAGLLLVLAVAYYAGQKGVLNGLISKVTG